MSKNKKPVITFKPVILALSFWALFGYGCQIKGSFRGLTSYYHISKKECGESFCSAGSALGSVSDSCVIKLSNGKAVKNYLEGFSKSVVYIWDPVCKGPYCISINLIRQKCESENLKLVVVMESYDCEQIAIFFDKKQPVIGIDTRYYKTNFTDRYLKKFMFDLTGIKDMGMAGGRYFFFEKGKYVSEQLTL